MPNALQPKATLDPSKLAFAGFLVSGAALVAALIRYRFVSFLAPTAVGVAAGILLAIPVTGLAHAALRRLALPNGKVLLVLASAFASASMLGFTLVRLVNCALDGSSPTTRQVRVVDCKLLSDGTGGWVTVTWDGADTRQNIDPCDDFREEDTAVMVTKPGALGLEWVCELRGRSGKNGLPF